MQLIRAAAATFVLVAAATSASAQTATTADPSVAASGQYGLDKRHARLQVTGSHFGYSRYIFRIDGIDATLTWDGKTPASSRVSFTADTSTVNTGLPDFDKEVAGWLGAAPASFTSTRAEATGQNTGKLYGDLTLNGVTKPVVFDVALVGAGPHPFNGKPVAGFSATTTIKRSDFKVAPNLPANIFGDVVTVSFDGEFTRR